ncbi:MAG: VWA domain-containing protein, partial [Lachnospiraceae bacterium]|nr:VWA domain-containing protein [Lachnospiraceae bacterium]
MKKKSIVSFLAWGLGMVLSAVPVMAASAPFLQGYHTEEGQLQFYMASQGNTVAADQLTVTLSGEEVPVSLIETTSQIPVTYYCLTDVSGSMREEQFAQVKDVLQAVCDGMTEGDNLVLATLGNQVETTGFLDDTEEITEAIRGLSVGNEDTNLYYGIVEAIRLLEENPEVCERKCLVILSDGKDDQKTGITKSEADAAVESSRIPVYTVATLRSEQTEEQLADAKLLGSFANESAGGAHYTPMLTEGENGTSVGKAITGGMKQSLRVTTDTSGYQASKDILLLRVIYQNGGSVRLEDTMEVFAQELKYAETEPETEPET